MLNSGFYKWVYSWNYEMKKIDIEITDEYIDEVFDRWNQGLEIDLPYILENLSTLQAEVGRLREALEFYAKEPPLSVIHPGTSKEYIAEMMPPLVGYKASEEIPIDSLDRVVPFGSVAREALQKNEDTGGGENLPDWMGEDC